MKVEYKDEDLSKALDQLDELIKGGCDKATLKKGGDKDEEEDKDDPSYREDEEEDTEKSFAAEAAEHDSLQKGMEVSDFLNDLVTVVGDSIDGLKKSMTGKLNAQNQFNSEIAKSFMAVAGAVQSLVDRMDAIEKAPVGVKKSITATAVERKFADDDKSDVITKSMVMNELNDRLMKSDPTVSAFDVVKFETSGELRPDLKASVMKSLKK